jgi:predicted HTH domain antitoxin
MVEALEAAGMSAPAHHLRTLWLIEQTRERRLGHGKAAELAGLPRARFLQRMGRHHVSPFDFDFDEDELDEEFRAP